MSRHRGDCSKGGIEMSDDFNGLHCSSCYYAVERYNRKGTIIGYDCGKDNMRFIDLDLANVMCCGAYAERDCDE